MTPARCTEPAGLTIEELTATVYLEAAEGDYDGALLAAVAALIACERRLWETERRVSYGYVRAALTSNREPD